MGIRKQEMFSSDLRESRTIENGVMDLFDGFWTNRPVTRKGALPPFAWSAAQTQAANDIYYGEDLRNHLFGMPGAGGWTCAL
ncbi:MAG: hypothetical protein Ct9H90mP16_00800 [Candidatus Poseidoniales archaeon]|nr:MAG: hypothetical protein Ct9H90mP16_00800 [Candidatus Poseidoniales archaeon]